MDPALWEKFRIIIVGPLYIFPKYCRPNQNNMIIHKYINLLIFVNFYQPLKSIVRSFSLTESLPIAPISPSKFNSGSLYWHINIFFSKIWGLKTIGT